MDSPNHLRMADGEWRREGEGWGVKGREEMGLGIWDRACYHCWSGRDLGSASQDGKVGGIVLIMQTNGMRQPRAVLADGDRKRTATH